MQLPELLRALRQLGLSGMADTLETRLVHAQAEQLPLADFLALLLQDELTRRADRLLTRRLKEAQFRDPDKTLDNFDFGFNQKLDRRLVFELATGRFLTPHDDVVFLGPPAPGKGISPRPWGAPSSSRAIASSTARRTGCSRTSPTRPSPGPAASG